MKKDKKKNEIIKIAASIAVVFALSSNSLFAQDGSGASTVAAADTIGGMSSSVFYVMASVIFLELLVILVLLLNVRVLLKVEKEKLVTEAEVKMQKIKKPFTSLWNVIRLLR
ncbi:MAG: hypothetical protein WDO19_26955 [Bacteroidota bacterium]